MPLFYSYFVPMQANERSKLTRLRLSGLFSFDERGETIELGDINLFVGENGAGKSNLVGFFRLLSYGFTRPTGNLQGFIQQEIGGASALLHYGPKYTERLHFSLEFQTETSRKISGYEAELVFAAGDRLIVQSETTYYHNSRQYPEPRTEELVAQNPTEFELPAHAANGSATSRLLLGLLQRIKVYHFHDTSKSANCKTFTNVADNNYLREDAGNIAAFLLRLQEQFPEDYQRIRRAVQSIVINFDDFVLAPQDRHNSRTLLRWQDRSGMIFGPHQFSDGSLRFICICVALLQPVEVAPNVVVIDEPELGLHPRALTAIAEMVHLIAGQQQVIFTTQSPRLLDEFSIEQVQVFRAERKSNGQVASRVLQLKKEDFNEWMKEYTTGELLDNYLAG